MLFSFSLFDFVPNFFLFFLQNDCANNSRTSFYFQRAWSNSFIMARLNANEDYVNVIIYTTAVTLELG